MVGVRERPLPNLQHSKIPDKLPRPDHQVNGPGQAHSVLESGQSGHPAEAGLHGPGQEGGCLACYGLADRPHGACWVI